MKNQHEDNNAVTGFAPDTSRTNEPDDLDLLMNDGSLGTRGSMIVSIPVVTASDEEWNRWLDSFLGT